MEERLWNSMTQMTTQIEALRKSYQERLNRWKFKKELQTGTFDSRVQGMQTTLAELVKTKAFIESFVKDKSVSTIFLTELKVVGKSIERIGTRNTQTLDAARVFNMTPSKDVETRDKALEEIEQQLESCLNICTDLRTPFRRMANLLQEKPLETKQDWPLK